jgi:hypothetical protein
LEREGPGTDVPTQHLGGEGTRGAPTQHLRGTRDRDLYIPVALTRGRDQGQVPQHTIREGTGPGPYTTLGRDKVQRLFTALRTSVRRDQKQESLVSTCEES